LDRDVLDVHGRGLGEGCWSAGPLAGSVSRRGRLIGSGVGTSNPVAHLDPHRSLGEVPATKSESITIVESANKVAIDRPLDVCRSPIDGISVPGFDRGGDVFVDSTVIGSGISFSEEVALDRTICGTQPLPVDLVEVIRFEDEAGNYASARGSPDERVNLSEEDVFLTRDGWGIGGCVDGELSAVRPI
jgi:hypothetical protein